MPTFQFLKSYRLFLSKKFLITKFYIEQDPDPKPVYFRGRIRIRMKMVWIRNTPSNTIFNSSALF
jgi:hypothetical protein